MQLPGDLQVPEAEFNISLTQAEVYFVSPPACAVRSTRKVELSYRKPSRKLGKSQKLDIDWFDITASVSGSRL